MLKVTSNAYLVEKFYNLRTRRSPTGHVTAMSIGYAPREFGKALSIHFSSGTVLKEPMSFANPKRNFQV